MWSMLTGFAAKYGAKILGVAGIVAAGIAVLTGAKRAGRDAERAQSLGDQLKRADDARKIENRVRAGGATAARDSLRRRQQPGGR